jgi:hypothetical protein
MSDEEIQEGSPVEEEVTEPIETEEEVTEQPQETTQSTPEWKSRYRSEEEMWEATKRFQSEAARAKAELEQYQQSKPTPDTSPEGSTNEELLDKFVKNPQGFMEEMMAPVKAQIALTEFQRTHKDFDDVREVMASVVNRTPAILADPEGLEMAYNHAKAIRNAQKMASAAETMQSHKQQVTDIKKTDAQLESSTQPKKEAKLELKPGMDPDEMDAILDKKGSGWHKRDT